MYTPGKKGDQRGSAPWYLVSWPWGNSDRPEVMIVGKKDHDRNGEGQDDGNHNLCHAPPYIGGPAAFCIDNLPRHDAFSDRVLGWMIYLIGRNAPEQLPHGHKTISGSAESRDDARECLDGRKFAGME